MTEIYNERMERIENPDLSLGWLEKSVRTAHHDAREGVQEQWHYEVIAEYPNGGRSLKKVIDVPGRKARKAWEERIAIWIYHPYTQEELEKQAREAAVPTLEERMKRLESAVGQMSRTMEKEIGRWSELIAARGEE